MRVIVDKWDIIKALSILGDCKTQVDRGLENILEGLVEMSYNKKISGVQSIHNGLSKLYRALANIEAVAGVLDRTLESAEYVKEEEGENANKDNGSI